MLSTTPNNGVSNLVASTRTFSRSRERNFNHNLNQLINLTNGVSPDPLQTTALSDFLVTTTWRPSESAYHALTHDGGLPNPLRLNHSTGLTRDIYYTARVPQEILGEKGDCMGEVREEEGLEGEKGFFEESLELELVPLYWSAGLVLHPQFTAATYNYQKVKKLENNETLRVLSFFSSSFLSGITHHFDHFSKGQLYTGVELNVFKKPMDGLLLTSFEGFNPHVAGFQQNPWMANIAGIPVWSQSGGGKEGLAGFSMTNTHNPNVTQKGSSACITYLTPKAIKDTLITRQLFSSAVRFFWPDLLFDQLISAPHKTAIKTQKPSIFRWFQASKPPQEPGFSEKTEPGFTWQVGRRDRCYIGVLCTKEYRVRVKRFKGKRGRGEPYLKIRGDEARRYLAMEEKKNYNTMNNDSKKGFNEDSVSDTTVEMVESGLIGNDKESDELRGFPDGLEGVDKKLISAHFENDPLEEDENAIISNDVEVQEKPLEVEVPVSYFQCSDHRQSWVVVVGVSNDFVDINEFLERRCRAISIQEMVQNGFYEIQIFDPREGNLSYIYNENTI